MEYGKKVYSNGPGGGPGHLLFFIIVNLRGAGDFSRDFTINLSLQCRAFSRALKTEKLKAPLFPGLVGAGITNDWRITSNIDKVDNLECTRSNISIRS